ncbi:DUF3800 domain-containing protein [Rhizobium rhizoryzae]|uniref:DUF3800 domain-containing protein n=1 Tax=Rhizobium rhizoryzae TaxID=451876 RepID=A0A7W6LGB3_9HYPH|nr:DUF3800 domain-containing protein [Rhizobium rhizoryzae]MBB4142732.1 hypothetical protein [Rhizobium rhizoryzae]
MYVDEVGHDDLTNLEEDNYRYLSLTGIAMKVTDARDDLTPRFDWIKANVFDHDPDDPLIFHRSDIVQRKRAFGVLNDDTKRATFDAHVLGAMSDVPYTVITALIDKHGMVNQPNWRNQHPYHYLMEILVEKFVQFLERKNDIGDIMPEGRKGKKDAELQKAFTGVLSRGTYYVSRTRMNERISSQTLKIRYKPNNIAGLQLCDLLAHPSHIYIRQRMGHAVTPGDYCNRVTPVLVQHKYDRSQSGFVRGYGYKWLP